MNQSFTGQPVMPQLSVVKVGGSLLSWPLLGKALNDHLAQLDGSKIILFGGGKLVDAIRMLDSTHSLPNENSHWLSIEAMDIHAQFGASLVAEARLVNRTEDVRKFWQERDNSVMVFECSKWLRDRDRAGTCQLEKSWNTTSDSIAAALAMELGADQLELLKSDLPRNVTSIETAIRTGFVDACFSSVLNHQSVTSRTTSGGRNLRPKLIRFTNLRAARGQSSTLKLDRKTGEIIQEEDFVKT